MAFEGFEKRKKSNMANSRYDVISVNVKAKKDLQILIFELG